MRIRLLNKTDDIVQDWVESDDYDGELESVSLRLGQDGEEEDEEAYAALGEVC